MRIRMLAVLIAGTLFCAGSVNAVSGDAEVNAAQNTITEQLRAFQANDGEAAYSHAAPNIKQMFPTVERFMMMVTNGYSPVRHPRDFTMGRTKDMGDRIFQEVLLTGPDGKQYEAIYTLDRQSDGNYRISSVTLREAKIAGA